MTADDWRKAAEAGDAQAMYRAALAIHTSAEMPEEDKITRDYWCLRAAYAGHAPAMMSVAFSCKYGTLYVDGKCAAADLEQSAYWYQQAAEHGDGGGMYCTWDNYRLGQGVEQDMAKAVSWLKKAAEDGHVRSQIELGNLYYNGEYLAQDKAQAAYWYNRMYEENSNPEYMTNDEYNAISRLGHMYCEGEGIAQNSEKGEHLLHYLEYRGQGILS